MPFRIVIEPRALADIQQGIDYYEERLAGLGKRFSKTVDLYITVLSNNPYYQIRYKDYRGIPTGKFPYLIVYFVDEQKETVYIMAVFHTSQNTERLPE